MATEIVQKTAPEAFHGWDSSVYMAWMKANSDMLLTGGDATTMDHETLKNYGGLMHALSEALDELQTREMKALRA